MLKVVKEREICECCGNTKNYEVEEYFCDFCNELIAVKDKSKYNMLDITIFCNDHNIEPYDLVFCSWKCLMKKLKTIKNDGFISLPNLIYVKHEDGITAKDFFKLLK